VFLVLGKVKSSYKPSGSSDWSLFHPGFDASPSQVYLPALNLWVPIYTPGWREAL